MSGKRVPAPWPLLTGHTVPGFGGVVTVQSSGFGGWGSAFLRSASSLKRFRGSGSRVHVLRFEG